MKRKPAKPNVPKDPVTREALLILRKNLQYDDPVSGPAPVPYLFGGDISVRTYAEDIYNSSVELLGVNHAVSCNLVCLWGCLTLLLVNQRCTEIQDSFRDNPARPIAIQHISSMGAVADRRKDQKGRIRNPGISPSRGPACESCEAIRKL